jgi:hypothetical protein
MVNWTKWKEYATGARDITRRDFLKIAGGATIAGSTADFAEDGDHDTWDFTTGVLGALDPNLNWPVSYTNRTLPTTNDVERWGEAGEGQRKRTSAA